jgi:hypothetical protein
MKRISISFELREDRSYDSFFLRLLDHGAEPHTNTLWFVLTALTVEEIRRDLQAYIDPADRLIVMQVASMSARNPIDENKFGRGAA